MLIHARSDKPNILFILTDQQRYDAVGYVNQSIYTPNLNNLAEQSINCTQTIVQSPQCQPSRASILTGRYPTTLKMWWNDIKLDPSEQTIGNILRGVGYRTGYFGKIHIDGNGTHTDTARHFGFDDTFLYHDWVKFINSSGIDGPRSKHRVIQEFYKAMESEPWVYKFSGRELHHDDMIVEKAIDFIDSSSLEPFFCVVGFYGPHPPYASPPPFNSFYDVESMQVPSIMRETYSGVKLTDDLWRQIKSQYFGSVSWIDDNIGRILQHVSNDTIVVFTSDHGDILGDHGYFSKGLFAYDGNVRVPLLMRFPTHRAVRYDHIVQSIDIVPTLLQAVGIDKPVGIQGKSLLDAFANGGRVNHWAFSGVGWRKRLRMLRTTNFKYWLAKDEFLFDIQRDPSEAENIASVRKDIAQKMQFMLLKALVDIEDPLPLPIGYQDL